MTLSENQESLPTTCIIDGEAFIYPDWVQAIADGITLADFIKQFPQNVPKTSWRGIQCLTWTQYDMNVGITINSGTFHNLINSESLHTIPFKKLLGKTNIEELIGFVTSTRGHTNNNGKFLRGSDNNTTDAIWRNNMVCLAYESQSVGENDYSEALALLNETKRDLDKVLKIPAL